MIMKVWAYEVCYCKYETGYAVDSLFKTKEAAERYMNTEERLDRGEMLDGAKVVEWEIKE